MKKKILIIICVSTLLVLLICGGLAYMSMKSLGLSIGRVIHTNNSSVLILENSPIVMSNQTENERLFDKLSDGDKVLVIHDGVAESYPAKTGTYAVLKLADGSMADISTDVLTQLAELGWMTDVTMELPEIMPKDFFFALTWNTYGISSYDSNTGKLVKTTDATHPEDYITFYTLSNEDAERIYDLIQGLNVNDYPEIYDPHEGGLMSRPSMTLILTVRVGDKMKSIKAKNIAITYDADNKKGQKFLLTCKAIRDILTATEEWKALPEYEVLYE